MYSLIFKYFFQNQNIRKMSSEAGDQEGNSNNWWFWDYAGDKAPHQPYSYYIWFSVMALAYHCLVHFITHTIAMYIGSPTYVDRTTAKKTEYRTNVVSITHSFGCLLFCTWGCFFVCEEGKTVFNDDKCINTVRYVHVWALLHTCSYFLLDAWILCFVVKGFAPLDIQTYAHHLILALTFYQTLYFMDYMCVFGVMMLYMEISTIFMNMRTLLFHHGM